MTRLERIDAPGYEAVYLASDPSAGYRGVLAVHSTALGPAVGGTRFWRYDSDAAAIRDALRLARGMSFKTAMAGLDLGGGKSVILAPRAGTTPAERPGIFRAHGRAIEELNGLYVTAPDVGVAASDLAEIRRETRHVLGLVEVSGDSGRWTAQGVLHAMRAAVRHRFGGGLAGIRVGIQGCGSVGAALARLLQAEDARLVVTDADESRAAGVAEATGARLVPPDAIYDAAVDVFAPCALGGILDDETIGRLRARVVAGGANNQLHGAEHADALAARDILYMPDYLANAGGVITGCAELRGWTMGTMEAKVAEIEATAEAVLARAAAENVTPSAAADRIAAERIRSAAIA